jgi:hypothetical protein
MRIILLFIFLNISLSFSQQVTIIPSPNPSPNFNILRGISGTSLSNLWAVGSYDETGNIDFKNLVLKWNGSAWSQVNVPSPDTDGDLWAVSALNNNSVWAGGTYASPTSLAQPQILKWNGTSWNLMSLPSASSGAFIWDIEAIAENNVWAVGGAGPDEQSFASVAYVLRWNGSSWSRLYVPPFGQRRNRFTAFDYISANDVWAVGSWGHTLGTFKFLIMHWDGSNWTQIPSPLTDMNGEFEDIQAVSPNDIWAIGGYITGGSVYLHWNGSSWSTVPSPGSAGAIAALSSNNVYTVGSNVANWNGSEWTVVDNLGQIYGPALSAATVLPSGEVWAAGRFLDPNDQLMTLTVKFMGGQITSVGSNIGEPKDFILIQNHPNPFNPVTFINYNVSVSGNVKISVFDITGKAISTLVDKKQNSGTYKVKFDGSGLNSGIYFYSMSINGNIIDTKKMTLIK